MKHRILVCGGRHFQDRAYMDAALKYCKQWFAADYVLIHGGARGADIMAHVWAFFEGCPVIRMDANWDFYGKKAGPIRNTWMLKYATPDLVIAFPGGGGTADMVAQAEAAGIDVFKA